MKPGRLFNLSTYFRTIHDLKGRKEAKNLGLRITGTLGVLYKAKQSGLISDLKTYIEMLIANGFRVSESVVNELLKETEE